MSELDTLSAGERASFEWGRVHGIYSERAAIVAWLREQTNLGTPDWGHAAAIERGEHLGADDE